MSEEKSHHQEVRIGVSELVNGYGMDERKARRLLNKIEEDHPGTVHREGGNRKMWTTPDAIKSHLEGAPEDTAADKQVRILRGRVIDLEKRVDALARQVGELLSARRS